jgi:hypothetical protein
MKPRITVRDLQAQCDILNRAAGYPDAPYSKTPSGSWFPNVNVYHLDGAYGGYKLSQMSSEPGCTGTRDVLSVGYRPKRELLELIHAYRTGRGC